MKSPLFAGAFRGCVLAACVSVGLAAQQSPSARNGLVHVTGEFLDDGSCRVVADGRSLFQTADSAQTTYVHDASLNIAPAGFDAHELWCTVRGPQQPLLPPVDLHERLFVVLLYAPNGQLARKQRYDVLTGIPTAAVADHVVGAAIFGMSPQLTSDSLPVRLGVVYLTGIHGSVDITRVEAARIVAKFSFDAQTARSF